MFLDLVQAHVRDASQFSWYVIPLFLFVLYVYAQEVEKRNWNVVFAGVAFWGMDVFNEIVNGIVAHQSGHPIWGTAGPSAYTILIGLNIEICFMFAIMGVVAVKLLPPREVRILGMPNRVVLAIVNSWMAVGIEILLNHIGVLTWHWSWWQADVPWLIFGFGYLPFFSMAFWIYDRPRRTQIVGLSAVLGVDAVLIAIFGGMGWL